MEELLQTLFHDAIHAADRKYFKGLRVTLQVFHDKKNSKGVDNLLLRIYGPILWRSLCCTNALVRAQATIIFFDAFPLQGNNNTANECDILLQKQFNYFNDLLKDNDQYVRSAAASGVCHILRNYWEVIPINTTHQILKYIICTLGKDVSCPSVRVAVVSGLNELLDQPLSHTVLKSLLPQIADTLHDKSLAVRIAFVGILSKVRVTMRIYLFR